MARLQTHLLIILVIVLTIDLSLAFSVNLCVNNYNYTTTQEECYLQSLVERENNTKLYGLIPAVFTAFHDNYTINYDIIPDYAKYMACSGFKGVLVGGTAGQHMALNFEDRKKLICSWVQAAKAVGLKVVAQVGAAPYPDVMNLAKFSKQAGADAVMTLPEMYFRPKTVEELVTYVEDVSKAARDMPIYYYHSPSTINVNVSMTEFAKAASARIPTFVGIKSSSTDQAEGTQVMKIMRPADQEFFIGGYNILSIPGLRSSMSAAHTLFPKISNDLVKAVESQDKERAACLQDLLIKAVKAHLSEGGYNPAVRAGVEITSGLKMGPPARPLKPLSAEAKQKIHCNLKALGLVE